MNQATPMPFDQIQRMQALRAHWMRSKTRSGRLLYAALRLLTARSEP